MVEYGAFGLCGNRAPQRRFRFVPAPQARQQQAQIGVGLGVIRVQARRGPIRHCSLLVATERIADIAEIIPYQRRIRIDANGSFQHLDSARHITLFTVQPRQ